MPSLRCREESIDIGEDISSPTPPRAPTARWLRLSDAQLSAIRESIHFDALAASCQDLIPGGNVSPVCQRHAAQGQQQRAALPRSPVAYVRESIHAEGGLLGVTSSIEDQQAIWGEGDGTQRVTESLNLHSSSPSSKLNRASTSSSWDIASPRRAASGSEGGLGATLSIVERIKHLDVHKKQAVAR